MRNLKRNMLLKVIVVFLTFFFFYLIPQNMSLRSFQIKLKSLYRMISLKTAINLNHSWGPMTIQWHWKISDTWSLISNQFICFSFVFSQMRLSYCLEKTLSIWNCSWHQWLCSFHQPAMKCQQLKGLMKGYYTS